jgi:trans-2,3-dihydro-3-hydroxyanthranilate isomerase
MTHSFFVVDVFAERPYSGNPLAVVVSDEPLAEDRMQQIAAETNYSETTFVTPRSETDNGYRVRIFTPAREIPFAGHPILGTAWVLRQRLAPSRPESLYLNLPVGRVRVTFESGPDRREIAWFTAPAASLGQTWPHDHAASLLGVSMQDIDPSGPVQQVSAGVSVVIVPLRTLEALRRCTIDTAALARLASHGMPSLVYLYCRETRRPENDMSARFFFGAHGAREDPATGNGAAFLGAYLLAHRRFPVSGFSLRIEQGYEVRRPSLVLLRARALGGEREVLVGGSVVPTVRGELV